MSTFARLTLIGLYNHDDTLFDKLTLPAAYDRQTFIDTVLMDQGEKCVAYPDPDFFKYAIGVWARKWSDSLERIALAINSEYNPIHNYDRYEEWTEKEKGDYKNELRRGGSDSLKKTGSVTVDNDGTVITENDGTVTTSETGTDTETTNNMVTERTVSAFNENGYQPDEKSTVNGSVTRSPNTTQTVTPDTTETATTDATEKTTFNTDDTTAYNGTENGTGDDRRDRDHSGHLYGNIGVTTSQQMIEAEIDLRKNYNMYTIAATLFADELLLMIY